MNDAARNEDDELFLRCYVCGTTALWVIEVAGEDEPREQACACAIHARGHVHRGILTPVRTERDESSTVPPSVH